MREIKFRAYFEHSGLMEPFAFGSVYDEGFRDGEIGYDDGTVYTKPDVKVMQYTGLKDKNGVEIYEGDLVRHSLRATPLPVGFSEGSFVYIDDKAGLSINCDVWEEREVIGNIYENSHLLKEEEE